MVKIKIISMNFQQELSTVIFEKKNSLFLLIIEIFTR